jgi:small-conductance mechanosensitive channel
MRAIFRRVVDDLTVENLIKQFAYYSVWTLGLIVAVDALGFDPETVVTGLGLTGLALGFALKDIISNFVSGILILTLRPFRLGDQIIVGDTEGAVERIELRATEIRTYDGRLVLVPNAEVFTSRVTNNTASPVRRGAVEIHLGYEVDLQRAAHAVREGARQAPGVLEEPPATVRVRELGQDDLVLEARFWTDSRRTDYLDTASAVRTSVVAALKAAAIALPEPDLRYAVHRSPGSGDGESAEGR